MTRVGEADGVPAESESDGCPDENDLVAFVEGGLSDAAAVAVEQHATRCVLCRQALAVMARSSAPTRPGLGFVSARPSDPMPVLVADGRLSPGTLVDSFLVLRHLGSGGMGRVYLARDTRLGRKVALKFIRTDVLGSADAVERFLREAQITALFSHPHIVTIYEVGRFQGCPYLALEYLEGQTLDARMREGSISVPDAARVGAEIAQALDEAHRRHVLHRDLKPSNVLLPSDGRLRVLDFGLATAVPPQAGPEAADAPSRERSGESVDASRGVPRGTPRYMAPEQWEGKACTTATDVWALGMILWEMLGGGFPFRVASASELRMIVCSLQPAPQFPKDKDVPLAVASLISSCLSPRPAERPALTEIVRILESARRAEATALVTATSPFRGLLPLTEQYAPLFFGREAELDAAMERLRQEPFLAVVGPSGAGKSSFVRAGVIPRLREMADSLILKVRPGRHPVRTLAHRLCTADCWEDSASDCRAAPAPRLGGRTAADVECEILDCPGRLALLLAALAHEQNVRVVVFVDQLEELVTLAIDDRERQCFLDAVCLAADDPLGPVRVVVTVRDDFLGLLAQGETARESLRHVVLLRTPSSDALCRVLEGMVGAFGFRFDDPALVPEMVAGVRGEPAALPLLQFVGQALWDRRDSPRRLLTGAAYDAVGGVAGALAHHADGVLDRLPTSEVRIARAILLRLVTPDRTRRVLPRSDLLDGLGPEGSKILETLCSSRLLLIHRPHGEDTETEVEIVHESLASTWQRYQHWIEESREDSAFRQEVEQAAALWAKRGRREEECWEGPDLDEAFRRSDGLNGLGNSAREFLAAGKRRSQRRRTRRRVTLAIAACALAGVAILASVVAWIVVRQKTDLAAKTARLEVERTEALREAAEAAFARGDMLSARAQLRVALETRDTLAARSLWGQLRNEPLLWSKELPSSVNQVAFSPDGRNVGVACAGGQLYLLNAATAETQLQPPRSHHWASIAFSPEGDRMAAGGQEGRIALGSLATERWDAIETGSPVSAVAFHPRSSLWVSGHVDGTIVFWDAREKRRELRAPEGCVETLAFSPDGSTLASAGREDRVFLWDVSTGVRKADLRASPWIRSLAFHPDSSRLAAGSSTGWLRMWDLASGVVVEAVRGTPELEVAFRPDGGAVATGGPYLGITIRLVEGLKQERQLPDRRSGVLKTIAYSPDGSRLVSGGTDRTVRMWRPDRGPSPLRASGHPSLADTVIMSPDERWVLSGGQDLTTRVWDAETGEVQRELQDSGMLAAAFSLDGSWLVRGDRNSNVERWSHGLTQHDRTMVGSIGWIWSVGISPDGRRVAAGGFGGAVRLWDASTGKDVKRMEGHTSPIARVVFSPNSRTLATAARDGSVRLWDAEFGSQREDRVVPTEVTPSDIAYDPDGTLVGAGVHEGNLRVWDLLTARTVLESPVEGRVSRVALSLAGDRVAVGFADGTLGMWTISSGARRVLRGHKGSVLLASFSPSGKLFATTSVDDTLRLWNLETGRPAWYSPLLLAHPPVVYSHRGWKPWRDGGSLSDCGGQWRSAVERDARTARADATGRHICLLRFDDVLEFWDTATDEVLFRRPVPAVRSVAALSGGCLTLAESSKVVFHDRASNERILHESASAIGADLEREEWLVVGDDAVHTFSVLGVAAQRWPAVSDATAVARIGSRLAVGGCQEIRLVGDQGTQRTIELAGSGSGSSAVATMVSGPAGTVVAGFENGFVGVWNPEDESFLLGFGLHGPVTHLVHDDGTVVANTDLGDTRVIDLSVLQTDGCLLMRDIWAEVDVVAEGSTLRERKPPRDHPCVRYSGSPF
jgi:WD40 repeat protein/tRNA A-37 threonylcarbamoyl transferase component Bud32